MEAKHITTWDYLGYREKTIESFFCLQKDWNQTLITKINQLSAQIYKSSFRGANLIKVNSNIFKILKTLEYLKINDESLKYYLGGKYLIEIDESLDNVVYVINDLITDDNCIGKIEILNYNSKVDENTGESIPYSKDIFFPSPNYSSNINSIFDENGLNDVDNLKYFFDKYLKSVEDGKPNIRMGQQLKILIDTILIKDSQIFRYNIFDGGFKQKFVIPIKSLENKTVISFMKKLKENLFK